MIQLSQNYANAPYIAVREGTIVEANNEFLKLTGFEPAELIQRPYREVWDDILRIRMDDCSNGPDSKAFLFTKSLEVREARITFNRKDDCEIIAFEELDIPGIADRFPYAYSLCLHNNQGVAIWGIAQGIVLLEVNQTFLDFLDAPYNCKELTIGRCIDEFITGWKGSTSEQIWRKLLDTGEYIYISEYRYDGFKRGVTYWKATLMPIFVNNVIKYAVEVTEEITEQVLNRRQIEEQAKTIRQKNEQLKQILEHIPDAMIVFDNKGSILDINAEARRKYLNLSQFTDIKELQTKCQYFDLQDNMIPLERHPLQRAFEGERIRNEAIIIKEHGRRKIMEINATPVLGSDKSLLSLIVSFRDITEQREQQQQLIRAEHEKNQALKASMRMKDEFLYLITHEFKTPIAVVNSALQAIELICKNEVTEKLGRYIRTIKVNTNRQLRLVNNLLDITKANSGNIKLRAICFDVVHALKSIVSSVDIFAKQKGVTLSFQSSVEKKLIYLDEEKFERIILNLLSNALKFTPRGKGITLELSIKRRKRKEFLSICVSDEGIGIPKESQQKIFERFGQVDSSLSRQAEGTGLGLHLVNLLVKAMGGEIGLKSSPGKGSIFTILLPAVDIDTSKEAAAYSVANSQLLGSDNRIIQAASIEFSDIYPD